MEQLSQESKDRIKRFYVHLDRCRNIEKTLGTIAAHGFHCRWRGDPASDVAKREYERLVQGN